MPKYNMIYQLYTLVDITETSIFHGDDIISRNQQQNFDTVIQTIGLCGNIYFNHSPTIISSRLFPKQKCWYFEWSMELEELFKKGNDHVAVLKDIFEYVPFITDLTESYRFDKKYFQNNINIVFDYVKPTGLRYI